MTPLINRYDIHSGTSPLESEARRAAYEAVLESLDEALDIVLEIQMFRDELMKRLARALKSMFPILSADDIKQVIADAVRVEYGKRIASRKQGNV